MSAKIALVTLYTENIRRLAELTTPGKQAYCKKWGYDFVCREGVIDPERPPAWSKILLLRQLLNKYEWLFWLDADAMIMNPEIPLDRFIDDRYSMIVAKLESSDLFGDLHLNTGSFFIRSDDHARQMLDTIYQQSQYITHPCWEQKAFIELFVDQDRFRQRVKVSLVPTRFNAIANNYAKGDFVFHALGPIRTEEGKMRLIQSVIEEDQKIPFDIQPALNILFQHSSADESDFVNITLSSLMQNQESIADDVIHLVKNIDTDFGLRFDWHQANRESAATVCRLLDSTEDSVIVLVKPGVQFFSRWRRKLLVILGRRDMALGVDPETREVRDEVIIMKNNARTRLLWRNLEYQCDNAAGPGTSDGLRQLLDKMLNNSSNDSDQLSWTVLPEDMVYLGRIDRFQPKNILKLAVHGAIGPEETAVKREALIRIRKMWQDAIEKLKKTVIST
jgi:mannan polymerase II complex MNN10 subunit